MALATRCPHCDTVFRLDPHLLAPHDGRVRCGHCQEVFDAAHYQFELTPEGGVKAAEVGQAVAKPAVATSPEATKAETVNGTAVEHAAIKTEPIAPAPASEPIAETTQPAKSEPAFSNEGSDDAAAALKQPQAAPAQAPALDPFGKPHTKSFIANGDATSATSAAPADTFDEDKTVFAAFGHRVEESPAPSESLAEPLIGERVEPSLEASVKAPAGLYAATPAPSTSPADTQGRRFVRARTGPLADHPAEPDAKAEAHEAHETHDAHETRSEPFVGPSAHARSATPEAEGTTPPPASTPWPSDPEPRFNAPPYAGTHSGEAEPYPLLREKPSLLRSPAFWRVAGRVIAVVLAITLVLQILWWQRESVMVYFPPAQSLYAKACEAFDCAVTPPRDIDGLQIENSNLRQVDGPHRLELRLALRNRFDVALAYPALELTLLDDKNNIAIRRVLWPQDYARPGTVFVTGLAPRSTQAVIVRLDTGEAVAANYRVQVFYP
ncbi:FHA domain-containing protein [Caballeronia terrestris]|uniref:FHA domain-containing protein n=1 Tax=Caballeronia terrestris TaxID=1226301 RepID=A0A158FGY2_9BURK|nr:DUF3426 domain-containing protein [Caballeronia terrestris]SAL18951.1 FHA domain-containing protein [Caballeronia terrestris]